MKLKFKLFSLCLSFVMVLSVLVVGVWAITESNFQVAGQINFKTKGIEASISGVQLIGATFTDDGIIGTNRCNNITISETSEESELAEVYNSWKALELKFTQSEAYLKFTITNTKPQTKDYPFMSVSININPGTSTNAGIEVTNSNGGEKIYLASGDSVEYMITFFVKDVNEEATLNNFIVNFSLDRLLETPKESDIQLSYDNSGNYYYVTMGQYTVNSVLTPIKWRLASFDGITKFNASKSTPPKMYCSLSGDTAYQNVVFVQETYAMSYSFKLDFEVEKANDYAGSDIRAYLNNTSATAETGISFRADLGISTTEYNRIYDKIQVRYGGLAADQENSLYDDMIWDYNTFELSDGSPYSTDENSDKFWIMSVKEAYTLVGGGRVVNGKAEWVYPYKECNNLNWNSVIYWLRSPNTSDDNSGTLVSEMGDCHSDGVNSADGVRAAFYLNF